jgi:hypothetical protein
MLVIRTSRCGEGPPFRAPPVPFRSSPHCRQADPWLDHLSRRAVAAGLLLREQPQRAIRLGPVDSKIALIQRENRVDFLPIRQVN